LAARLLALLLIAFAAPARPGEEKECGTERWAVKIAADGAHLREAAAPEVRTVAQLSALEAPKYREGRPREGAELDVVQVVGYLRAVKLEEDGDLHILISDTSDEGAPTMIVEIPDPNCAARSPHRDRMATARAATAKLIGAVFGRKFRTLPQPKHVRVTGAIFFDKRHGQTGAAANGVELHPVLGLEAQP
jgi:hypothetical protein